MTTFFDTVFDPEIVKATVQCPGCGRRLRCSCPACIDNNWDEATNGPGIGFTINVSSDSQACNDCGHTLHCDGWLDLSLAEYEDEKKYGSLAEGIIE